MAHEQHKPRLCRTLVQYGAGVIAAFLAATLLKSAAVSEENTASGTEQIQACTLKPGPRRTVTRVTGGDTLILDDGKELRLAGVLAPRARDSGSAEGAWPPENDSVNALSGLTLGKTVELAFGRERQDRYGRLIAHAFTGDGDKRTWVQGSLLAQGHVRAAPHPGGGDCLTELFAHERIARTAKLGMWPMRMYSPVPADRVAFLMSLRSTFQIVKGRVAEVAQTKSGTYLNFGNNWKEDFTVFIPKRIQSGGKEPDPALSALKDREVEVRGWIERRNGPMITITELAQIDRLGGDAKPDLVSPNTSGATGAAADGTASEAGDAGSPKEKRPEPSVPGALDL